MNFHTIKSILNQISQGVGAARDANFHTIKSILNHNVQSHTYIQI